MVTESKDAPEWKRFERLVAAIHAATVRGAKVVWNEKIDGRQFDVVVRFNDGLHDHLNLIECKCQKDPVPVCDVDAFVTKARSAKANKAIMASSSGFQSGCIKVAKENGVSLIIIEEIWDSPLPAKSRRTPMWQVYDVVVELQDGRKIRLRDQNGSLHYLLSHSYSIRKNAQENLGAVIERRLGEESEAFFDQPRTFEISLTGRRVMVPFELEPASRAQRLVCMAKLTMGYLVSGLAFDPSALEKEGIKYVMRDAITSKKVTIEALGLPLGFDTELQQGRFYTDPNLGNNYYVEQVSNGEATILLVESYCHGNLVQCEYVQALIHQHHYVPIEDPSDLRRLKRILKQAMSLRSVPGGR